MKKKLLVPLALSVLFISGCGLNSPDEQAAERAYKASSDYKKVVGLASMFGGKDAVTMQVNSVDNCEEHEFEDGDVGVACDIKVTVKAMGNTDTNVERGLFFEHPTEGWQYHGAL